MIKRLLVRRILVRAVFASAVVLTLLLAVIAFENWRGDRAWLRYRTAAEARGEKLWIEQFVAPPVPDAENFAAIPLIQELFAPGGAAKPSPLHIEVDEKAPRPSLANPALGERFDFVKWRDAFVAAKLLETPTDNAAQDLLRGLARFEPALQQLRDGAKRPHSRFPVKWDAGFGALLPHLGRLREAARLFSLRMEAHLALGNSAAAYADFRDALSMHRVLEKEPGLISGLVRLAILAQLESAVWDGLAGDRWADTELRALVADFAALRLIDDWRFAVASERGGANALIEQLLTHPEHMASRANQNPAARDTSLERFRARLPGGWLRQNQIRINESFDSTLARLDRGGAALATENEDEDRAVMLLSGSKFRRWYYMLASVMTPAFSRTETAYLAAHTTALEARTGGALTLYRHAHGTFPEQLEELVPELLEDVPLDICDGAPLRYRRTATGYELWSIGANRRDDDAQTLPNKSMREQPDWVWRM